MGDVQKSQNETVDSQDSSIRQLLLGNDSVNEVKSDKKLANLKESDSRNLSKHNKQYTRLLKAYISNYEDTADGIFGYINWLNSMGSGCI